MAPIARPWQATDIIWLISHLKLNCLHLYLRAFFAAFFLLTAATAFGQAEEDTAFAVPKARPMHADYHEFEQGMAHLKVIDTALYQMQKFDPGYLHNLGSPATPAFDLIWNPFKRTGFDMGFHQWDIYRLTDENTQFFNTQNPYASLSYVEGATDMQAFHATYSQNIRPYLNFSFHLNALNANKSYYDPQQSQITQLALNTWYRAPSNKYMLMLSAVFNNFQAQENGGIQSDSLFLHSSPGSRTGIPVNFGAFYPPDSSKQIWQENFVSARQYFRFGPINDVKLHDTDSVAVHIMHPEFFVSHAFEYHYQKYTYRDQYVGTPFTENILDPVVTNDNWQYEEFTNKVAIGHAEFNNAVRVKKKIDSSALKRHPLFYEFFAKYTIIKSYEQADYIERNQLLDNGSVGVEASRTGGVGFSANAEYFLEGYNKDDYNAQAHVYVPFIKKILPRFNIDTHIQQAAPAFTDQFLLGNHFIWSNSFEKSHFFEGSAYFSDSAGMQFGVAYQSASNLIYFDTSAHPKQDPGTVAYARFFVNKDIKIGHFHFLNSITWQKPISHASDVRVPEWLFRTSWYYEHALFKRALLLQGGIDFYYGTAYDGYGYMPEISKFYIQDKVTLGNYPVFDVWVAGKVKRFTFFGKLEHANQGLTGSNYFLVPHYPLYPLSYRFGIKWMFFN